MDVTLIEVHLNFESLCSVVLIAYALKNTINKMAKK